MSRIAVVGAGFGALTAVRKLRAGDRSLQIDIIAPQPEFVYYPGTIWIPTDLRKPEDLKVPSLRVKHHHHGYSSAGLG